MRPSLLTNPKFVPSHPTQYFDDTSEQIAAFAPVSGAYYVPGSNSNNCSPKIAQSITIPCNPGRNPLPILEFHGSADDTIPYSGGPRRDECLPTIPHWVREWSKREGFGLTNKTTALYGGKVLKYEYGGGHGELGIVSHYLVDGLGHTVSFPMSVLVLFLLFLHV